MSESESKEKENENKKDTLIITIGRMNPPTPGHMGLIKQMIENAIELKKNNENSHVAIILSHSQGNETDKRGYNKNPLNCKNYKRELVRDIVEELKKQMIQENEKNREYIEQIVPKIMCMDDEEKPNMYSSIGTLVRDYKPKRMIIVVGQDRDTDYESIQKYNPQIKIEIDILKRIMEGPQKSMSASEIREYVIDDHKDIFMEKMSPLGLGKDRLEELYGILKKELSDPIGKPNSKIAKPKVSVSSVKEKEKPKTTLKRKNPYEGGNIGAVRKSRKINKKTKKNKNKNKNNKKKSKSNNKKRIQ
jgi:hypothetical protein